MPLCKAHKTHVFKSGFSQISPRGSIFPLESDRKCSFRDSFFFCWRHFCFIRKFKVKKKRAETGERGCLRLSTFLTDFKLTIWSEPLTKSVGELLFGRIGPRLFQSVNAKVALWYFPVSPPLKKLQVLSNCLQAIWTIGLFLAAKAADPRWFNVKRLTANRAWKPHFCSPSELSALGILAGIPDL